MQLSTFYHDKRILITGHTGFKGGWLCHVMQKMGATVTGFALAPHQNSFFLSSGTQDIVEHVIGDICEYNNLEEILVRSNPDIVIHMAAQPLVRRSYQAPLETMQTNIIGTANLLLAASKCRKKPIVALVTSDKSYENLETHAPYKESDRMGGHDPYSASKGASELVIASIFKSFYAQSGQSAVVLRGGNVIGGGDWAQDRLMPDIIGSLKRGKAPIIRSPESIRPWQHILDVLSGYLSAIVNVADLPSGSFEQFNIGPLAANDANVLKLATRACDCWGGGIKPEVVSNASELHEAKLLKLDISKALSSLAWLPLLNFDETVKSTVEWYKAHNKNEDMAVFTRKQIDDYFEQRLKHETGLSTNE